MGGYTVLAARGGDADDRDVSVIRKAVLPAGPSGFDLAFERLYQLAYRVAFRMLGDRGDAEDVAQEALARAALRWNRLEERPEGWITRVASNLAIDRSGDVGARRQAPPVPSAWWIRTSVNAEIS